jgi:hypothetical protein
LIVSYLFHIGKSPWNIFWWFALNSGNLNPVTHMNTWAK